MNKIIDLEEKRKEKLQKKDKNKVPMPSIIPIISKPPIEHKEKELKWEEMLKDIGRKIDNNEIKDFICVCSYPTTNEIDYKWFGSSMKCSGLLGLCELIKYEIIKYMTKNG